MLGYLGLLTDVQISTRTFNFPTFIFQVIFVKKRQPFLSLSTDQLQCENDIYFSDTKIYAQYR